MIRKSLIKFFWLQLGIFILTINTTNAQTPSSFPNDSIGFFNSMEVFLVESRKEGKDFMKQFEEVWYGGYFSENQRKGVYATTNKMLKKKLRAFPDFRNYLFTVGSFVVDSNQTEESFQTWQGIIDQLLEDRRKKKFTDFLNFCNGLFRENAIYSSASTMWAANNSNYLFGFDSLPKITFQNLNLICFAKRDSMRILDTKGVYYPTEQLWYGYNGTVTWVKAGLLEDEVYGELSSYKIETRKSEFEADSVVFHNSFYLNKPLVGKLRNKLLANMTPERTSYPKFDSYDKRVRIENISPGVNFDGGFSMIGAKLLAKGDDDQDARIEFMRNDTLFLLAESESFSIRTDKIVSTQASVKVFLHKDSISHPGLNLKYLIDQKLVTLYRENKGVAITPYTNSFHDLEMDFEVLNWKTDEPILTLTNLFGGTKTNASFTSSDYFKEELFDKIGGISSVNPLFKVYKYMQQEESSSLSIKHLGYHMGMDYPDAKNFVIYLSSLGFADFEIDQDLVIIKKKLTDFVLAKTKKIDYDVINIYSDVSGLDGASNAKINLLNYDLTIKGIEGIVVSDSQQVVILPAGGQIKMKRNRYFEFSGRIKAGRFEFFGKKFSFDYEQFKINLTNTDSLKMTALSGEKDKEGRKLLKTVKTVIQNINGDLLIDDVFNKSGLESFSEYPILNSKDNSYVFYDKKEILGGVYKKGDFYFQVDPFTIDSLASFTNEQLKFDGIFSSGKIFPDFREQLTLQPDFSLGFIRETPPGGFPMYGGKGQFFDKIKLSHGGLRGDGSLKYITSTTYSNDFIFYPDSMRTLADNYEVVAQNSDIEFPPVKAEKTQMRWLPNDDVMYATTTDSGMVFYDKVSRFWGTTALTPQRLTGDGVYKFSRADLTSNQIVFKYITFDSDTADFALRDNNISDAFALKTKNLKAHVDYKERFAEFRANGKAEPIEFPINQYICFMEEFKWYMDNDVIDFKSSKSTQIAADVKLEGAKFISTNPDQDSLLFYSPVSSYDSRRHLIKAKEVLFINTADSRVYPDSGTSVTIKKNANMLPLVNSKITTNSVTEYHSVYEANTKIFGRKSYSSSGFIDYVDQDEKVQPIFLTSITVDTTGQTVGIGEIADSMNFNLSPNFGFDGKAKLLGSKQFLVFDGMTKINHACNTIKTPWVKFESEIDPKNIFIPVDTTSRDSSDAVIISSININTDSIFLYSSFMSGRTNYSDIYLLPTYGFIHYDKVSEDYIISSREKIEEPSLLGNYLNLNTEDCIVFGNGKIDIGARSGNVKFNSAGTISHNQNDNAAILDLALTIDFFFDDNATKKMAEDINENINLEGTDFSRATFLSGLKEIVGVETADEMESQMSLNGKLKRVPDELNKRLFLNDLKLKWVEDINSYKSFGKIGISNIGKEEINKYVDGKVMITKKRGGDLVDIYLEVDPKNWYYFTYRRGLMKVISSNEDFNTQIKELKKDKRKYQTAKGEAPFSFMFGSEREKRDFERDFDSEL